MGVANYGGDLQATAGVREGEIVAGKYRVDKILGAGGMGIVVAAHHVDLDHRVAIKFLLPAMLSEPSAVARFLREAKAAVRIRSEHVARVLDIGRLGNGAPYIVMEFLEGGDLAGWLRERGPLPIDQAVDFVLQACVAIADAHGLGIVHRDLKPANLFCVRGTDRQLTIKVLDFGISKMIDAAASGSGMSVTKTAAVMGSPLYMSPEQMRSAKDVDGQTDIWALGIILFELLAGRPPFRGDTLTEVAVNVATEAPPPLRAFRPEAPAALEAVVFRCLEKMRPARYRNVGDLALGLQEFGSARAKTFVERIANILQTSGVSPSTEPAPMTTLPAERTLPVRETVAPVGRTASPSARGKRAALGLAGVLLASVLVGSTVWIQQRRAASPAIAAEPAVPERSAAPVRTAAPAPPPEPAPAQVATKLEPAPTAPWASADAPVAAVDAAVAGSPGASAEAHVGPRPPANAVRPVGLPKPPVAAAVSPAIKPLPNCKPPYTLDALGHRQYKPECL